jgi:hypothetical protein
MMKSTQEKLSFLQQGVSEIEDYLLSEQLFWPLGSGERLTIGSLLLAEKQVHAVENTLDDPQEFISIKKSIDSLRRKWRSNWSNKAEKEFDARLRQWEQAIRELLEDRQNKNLVVYRQEVTLRVLLEILMGEIIQLPEKETFRLSALDRRLRTVMQPGEFIWKSTWQEEFPQKQYWFLYVSLPIEG